MLHYLFLAVYTLAIGFLTWKVWKKTRQIAFPIGFALLYYWSLLGAWFIVFDELTGGKGSELGLHYYHFNKLLFPVHADGTYLYAISLYAIFILTVQLTVLLLSKPRRDTGSESFAPIQPNHFILVGVCIFSALLAFSFVWKEILTAAKFHQSIYVVTRHQPGRFFTLHQLLNQVSVVALYIGLIACISGRESKFILGDTRRSVLAFYVFAVIGIEFYLLLMGNKREILFGGILAVIFYYNNVRTKMSLKVVALFLLIILLPLLFNDGFRAYSPTFLTRYFDTSGLELHLDKEVVYTEFTVKNSAMVFLFSNEMFCAHYSMYGAISHHVPFTYGSSVVSLAASLIPRALWPDRPGTIYDYYVSQVHAAPGQGYTIHHATGWYLNFGVVGMLAGAFLLGFFWVWLYNRFITVSQVKNNFLRILFVLGISAFTAQVPAIVRSGPEIYKAVVFEALLMPVLVIYLAQAVSFKKSKA